MPSTTMTPDTNAAISELLAEMLPHIRRVGELSSRLHGPARQAVDAYLGASLNAQLELKRDQLGVSRG